MTNSTRCGTWRGMVLGIAFLLLMAASSTPVRADRRAYVWTYEYMTKPPGGVEFEHYLSARIPDLDLVGVTSWEQRFELEIGLTERWDVSLYQIFAQNAGEGFRYDSFQLRTRIRLGEHGAAPVDPLLYFEYRRPQDLTMPNKLEGKLVLARDLRKVNIAVNLIEEVKFAPGTEWETGYAVGVSIEPNPVLKIGAEAKGQLATDGAEAHAAGPTVSVSRSGWYYTFGLAFGLNDAARDLEARAILGVDL